MFNIMKWEFRKQIHRLRWIVLGYIALLFIIFILPGNLGHSKNNVIQVLIFYMSTLLIVGTCGFFLYPIYNMLADFSSDYYILERMTGKKYSVRIMAKLLVNLCSFLIASGIGFGGAKLMTKFSTKNTNYFFIDMSRPYLEIMFDFVLFYPVVILFFYTLSSTLPFFKEHKILGTIFGIAGLIFLSRYVHVAGVWYYVIMALLTIALLFASGKLADLYYEKV